MSNPTSNAPMTTGGPKPFFQVWLDALTKPNEGTFAAMAASPNAKAMTGYLWVFIGSLVAALLSALVPNAELTRLLQQNGLGDQLPNGAMGSMVTRLLCGAPISALISTLFFAIGVVLVGWIAGMFGGKGTNDQLAYTFAAISAPFTVVSGLLSLLGGIPFVGLCTSIIILLGLLYTVVLAVMAVKGVYHVGWGGAAGAVLIPIAVGIGVCACALFAVGASIAAFLRQAGSH